VNDFEKELRGLINKHSRENESNTPDFILAQYMETCLNAFGEAVTARDKWYNEPTELVAATTQRSEQK